ncbi:YmdB family metallophosphoesterase, partial [Streptomyces sp. P17]|uniref:YmdB family metallophosphoesterase n=1 Tax=Streptomyces sp. P17 TaxID=3074716 RepID=UPI0028F3E464
EIFDFIDGAKKLIRPANFPQSVPGVGLVYVKVNAIEVAVINLQGRVFMNTLDDPFQVIEDLLEQCSARTNHIFVDFHAETTSEKQAMA